MSSRYDGKVIESSTTSARRDWIGLLARLVLGGAILVAGLLKITNLEGSVLSVRAYQLHFIPYQLQKVIGYSVPVVEVVLGALIIAGLFTRVTAALGTLMMLVYIAAITSAWARGLSIDCGCFSQGGQTDNPQYLREIIRDAVFALAGLWLVWRPRSRFSADRALFPPLTADSPDDPDPDIDDDEQVVTREDIQA